MPENQLGGARKLTIQEWLETKAEESIKYCVLEDRIFYNSFTGTCGAIKHFCAYRLTDGRCRKHGQKKEEQRHKEPQGPTIDDCANGGKQFYYGGVCVGEADCRFRTPMTFKVNIINDPLIDPMKTYAKCKKHNSPERCAAGSRMMFHKGVCLLTGTAECTHQVKELMVPLDEAGGNEFANCDKFNV